MSIRAASGLLLALWLAAPAVQPAPRSAQLVIVVDGLRPDYVTPELMPRLTQLGSRGIVFTAHHSVFPTVTRVNAASFVTGAYPDAHGLMGNVVYIPRANATGTLDTGRLENLEAIERADGRLLTAPTLGEILQRAGRTLLVVSSGTSGSALLLNHTAAPTGIVHPAFIRPPALAARAAAVLDPPPAHATPNDGQNTYAVEAYLRFGLEAARPDVTFMWLSDPDSTAHTNGVGTPLTRRALALVDAEIGRVEDALRARGLLDRTNIIVTSDHGFSTHTGGLDLGAAIAPFVGSMPDGTPDLIVAEGAIHTRSGADPARIGAIVAALQKRPDVGAIFTAPESPGGTSGTIPGTLSFEAIRWNHPTRTGTILVSANWTREQNAAGFQGTTTDGGVAGHGTSSPYDIHNVLMATGPDFREHATSGVPTGNVDIAPTLLRLAGLDVPETMAGRVIEEGFRTGPAPSSVRVSTSTENATTEDGRYRLSARFSSAAGRRYLDYTEVIRRPPAGARVNRPPSAARPPASTSRRISRRPASSATPASLPGCCG